MTPSEAHTLATTSPTRQLTARLGELKEEADRQVANLASTLKHIDDTKALLNEHGLTMTVDLGAVGNACAVARRQVEDVKDVRKFTLPRGHHDRGHLPLTDATPKAV